MKLVPQTSPLTTPWVPFLEDSGRQSYSYLLPFPNGEDHRAAAWTSKSQLDEWFDRLHPTHYAQGAGAWTDASYMGESLLRKTAWVTLQPGCECDYGYSDTWQTRAANEEFQQVVSEITRAVVEATGCTSLNSCNLNYYPRGGGVGWHADDEFLFDSLRRPTCIVSLSLCRGDTASAGARKFLVKLQEEREEDTQDKYDEESTIHTQILRHGDLLTMEGAFQKHYFHSVWPGDSKEHLEDEFTQGERINLTWRTIVQHLDGSEECRGKVCPLAKELNVPPKEG